MIEINKIRIEKENYINSLKKRGLENIEKIIEDIISLDDDRKSLKSKLDNLLFESNKLAKEIGNKIKSGDKNIQDLKIKSTEIKDKSKLISEGLNKSRLANIIDNLKKAEFAIQSSLSGHVKTLVRIRNKSSIVITLKDFTKLPEEIQFRIAANILEYVGKKNQKPRAKSVLNVMENIVVKDFKRMTVHGCIIAKKEKER